MIDKLPEGMFTLTNTELLALFDRASTEARWIPSADSQEYLAVVSYLVQRSK